MKRELCGAWMPLAKTHCAMRKGHKERHYSPEALERRREDKRKRGRIENMTPERAEHERERRRQENMAPEQVERKLERKRRWNAANPLAVYHYNQKRESLVRQAKLEAFINGQ